ncbi:hypothetical protein BDV95DRAFT_289949 [Massariosphaeria phaeospora]|uniref:Uncharacterized protein n=1 Tax=Massariosphaeria phaeospora TaxID=100035 RepID=A0A7C8I0L7_9PLEO|nr:hypothetical protein BDV95DRAFT_289949 [Massariosphaeria phaeospora]
MCHVEDPNIVKSETINGQFFYYFETFVHDYLNYELSGMRKTYFANAEEVETCRDTSKRDLGQTSVVYQPAANQNVPTWNTQIQIPERIMICSWVLNYWRVRRTRTWFDTQNAFKKHSWAAIAIRVVGALKFPFTSIDIESLFDKLLVHEMTHLHSTGSAVDVHGLPTTLGTSGVAYGWKAARYVAKHPVGGIGGRKNAGMIPHPERPGWIPPAHVICLDSVF